jgi:hypothetical protein
VHVTNRTTTPYNKESKKTLAKAIPIVSRTSGVLVSSVPYNESNGGRCAALLLCASEKV